MGLNVPVCYSPTTMLFFTARLTVMRAPSSLPAVAEAADKGSFSVFSKRIEGILTCWNSVRVVSSDRGEAQSLS